MTLRIRSIPRPGDTHPPYAAPDAAEVERLATWLASLTVAPVSAVEWRCPPGWSIRNRTIADDMAFCILSGDFAGGLHDAKNERPLRPGDMLLVPRASAHWIRRTGGTCRMVSLHMHVRVYGTVDALAFLGGGILRRPPDDLFRRLAMRLAREDGLRPPGWKRALRSGMESLVLAALREPAPDGRERRPPARELARLRPALQLVEDRLGDPGLRVRDLAQAVHASEPTLRAWFRRAFGQSPVAFLQRERVARACVLLGATDTPLPRVAALCGFRDLPFFYRVFKKITGTTPARYRAKREE